MGYLFLFFLLLLWPCKVDAVVTPPQKIVNAFASLVTSFLLADQIVNETHILDNALKAGKNKSATGDDIVQGMYDMATPNQMSQVASYAFCLYIKLGSQEAIKAALGKVLVALGYTTNAFFNQLTTKTHSMLLVPRGPNAIYLQNCRMCAQFMNKVYVCNCMMAVRNNLAQNEWDAIHGCVTEPAVYWSKCGF